MAERRGADDTLMRCVWALRAAAATVERERQQYAALRAAGRRAVTIHGRVVLAECEALAHELYAPRVPGRQP